MLKRFAGSMIIYGIAASLSQSISLILVPIYTRIFSPEEYGAYDIIFSVLMLVGLLGMLQLESAIARHYYESKSKDEKTNNISSVFWVILISAVVWMGLMILLSDYISSMVFNTTKYGTAITVASFVIPVSNVFAFFSTIMRFEKKPILYTFFVIIQLTTTILSSLWFVLELQLGIAGVFYGQFFGFLVASILMMVYLRSYLKLLIEIKRIKIFLKYSLPIMLAVIAKWLNSHTSRFVMLSFLPIWDVGLYTTALKVASVFRMLENAFRMTWGPHMWEIFTLPNHKEIYRQTMKYVTILVLTAILLFCLFIEEVLSFAVGFEFQSIKNLVYLISIAFGFTIISQTIGLGPLIRKKTIYNSVVMISGLAVNIIMLFILLPIIGSTGAALSLLCGTLVSVFINWYISEKLYFIGFSKTILFILIPIVFTVLGLIYFIDPTFLVRLWIGGGVIFGLAVFLYKSGISIKGMKKQ